MFYVTFLVVIQLFTLVTTAQIIHSNLENFIAYKLYFDKIIKRIDHRTKKSNLYHILKNMFKSSKFCNKKVFLDITDTNVLLVTIKNNRVEFHQKLPYCSSEHITQENKNISLRLNENVQYIYIYSDTYTLIFIYDKQHVS